MINFAKLMHVGRRLACSNHICEIDYLKLKSMMPDTLLFEYFLKAVLTLPCCVDNLCTFT